MVDVALRHPRLNLPNLEAVALPGFSTERSGCRAGI